ncbi:MAG: coproporphyrinogen dehydrogenase HemZ [Oscillospiraceae bacterium]
MELFLKNNDYKYAVEQIMLMLFPREKPVYPDAPGGGNRAELSVSEGKDFVTAACVLTIDGLSHRGRAAVKKTSFTDPVVEQRLRQRIVKLAFYRAGVRALGRKPVWGALSGIRPGKLMSNLLDEGLSDRAALSKFVALYDADPERAELCLDTAHASRRVSDKLEKRDVCLYLGVPFCPTRCAYCSFVSQSVEKSMKLIPPFVDALMRDIAATAEQVRTLGLRVIAVYLGGGTPTTLSPEQLDRVLGSLETAFDLSQCREITVEAGRPDTITADKLAVLARHGVSRVSVNPQTMSDRVLEAIGRRHTAADVLSALDLVRRAGSFDVNMDLIAGLPEDDPDSFARTLETVLSLSPENITVHTLALKKGSRITLEGTRLPSDEEVGQMLDHAQRLLRAAGYRPYYLYRQKFMAGGFENVGWCKDGKDNLYNICIMEELCSILAMGAGASTKLVTGTGRIERFFAPKYPTEYIENIEKVCADKSEIKEFYHELSAD